MSLSKQLSLGFISVLLLMLLGTLWTTTSNTRDFVSAQLQSHSQDTATSLGLSISPYLSQSSDLAVVETMLNAIFDSGYYSNIELYDIDGKILLSLNNPDYTSLAPSWFVASFDIPAPLAITDINDGWNIRAQLSVTSHTGLAHNQLWSNALDVFWLSMVLLMFALGFVWLIVKYVIAHPIQLVIEETEQISQQKFVQITDMPKTPELSRIVHAVNTMSTKLSALFKHLSEQTEKYRLFAYTDALTKMGNRRAFELHMQQVLRNEQDHISGHIVVCRASSLSQVHKQYGGDVGDAYLLKICHMIKDVSNENIEHFSFYRLSGADFALVIENSQEQQVVNLVTKLSSGFKQIEKAEFEMGTAHLGITQFDFGDDLQQLLMRADSALSTAINKTSKWELSENLSITHSNAQWREKINNILAVGTSDFVGQPIMNKQSVIEYSEWFARLPNEQNSLKIPMAQLIPASIRSDNAQNLDKLIVHNLMLKLSHSGTKVGVNISRLSIFDLGFMDWFISELSANKAICHNLIVEIPERALVHDIDALVIQTARLKNLGIQITVEHYGAQLAGILHLRALQPDYLKLDGRFTKDIQNETDNQLFVQSLVNIAHGLNIKVIAEMVETEAEKEWLENAQVDLLQGYFIASPKPV